MTSVNVYSEQTNSDVRDIKTINVSFVQIFLSRVNSRGQVNTSRET